MLLKIKNEIPHQEVILLVIRIYIKLVLFSVQFRKTLPSDPSILFTMLYQVPLSK
jgi:hypothetical protein